jgi:hypothetical protein
MEAAREAGSSWKARVSSSWPTKLVAAMAASMPASRADGSTARCGQPAARGAAERATVAVWKYIATTAVGGRGGGVTTFFFKACVQRERQEGRKRP